MSLTTANHAAFQPGTTTAYDNAILNIYAQAGGGTAPLVNSGTYDAYTYTNGSWATCAEVFILGQGWQKVVPQEVLGNGTALTPDSTGVSRNICTGG